MRNNGVVTTPTVNPIPSRPLSVSFSISYLRKRDWAGDPLRHGKIRKIWFFTLKTWISGPKPAKVDDGTCWGRVWSFQISISCTIEVRGAPFITVKWAPLIPSHWHSSSTSALCQSRFWKFLKVKNHFLLIFDLKVIIFPRDDAKLSEFQNEYLVSYSLSNICEVI